MFECKQCDKKFKKITSLSSHYSRTHKIKQKEFYIDYVLNGQKPTCKCGCGAEPKFYTATTGFSEFIHGHAARVNNNWGHNSSAQEKSQNKRRQMLKDGEYKVWNSGLTMDDPRIRKSIQQLNSKEANKKISIALTGMKKSPEHIAKITNHMRTYWGKEENREAQRHKRIDSMRKTDKWKCFGVCHKVFHVGRTLMLKSNYELNAFNMFASQESVERFEYESIQIRCSDNSFYLPDFIVIYKDGTKKIVEIKSEFYLKDSSNIKKFKAAQEFADKHGYLFEVWTEKTHPFLQNPV
jgi:hypothetical protein